jgi:type VI protein secretion system component VasK
VRKLLTFRWMSFHVLVIGCTVLFCILGHWQWDVGDTHRGTLRNFAYGMEWWVFAVILLFCWVRLLRQELSGETKEKAEAAEKRPRAPRYRVPAPQVTATVDDDEDPEMAAYNRYLNALHQRDTGAPEPSEAAPEPAAEVAK